MKRLKNIVLILLLGSTSNLISQELGHEAPTLQVGLNSLNFSKGTLDPEVIATIIAEKQKEIKIRVIQNSFLKKIYGSGGTIYNYADNVIKGVIQEPDTDLRTRKIMESTVNLVFVYTFVDFYLKQLKKDQNKKILGDLQKLAEGYKLSSSMTFNGGLNYGKLRKEYDSIIKTQPKSNDKSNSLITKPRLKGLTENIKTSDENDDLNKFISLLIDIASEVVRQDDKLSELGLMRISYSTNYDFLSMYNRQQNYVSYSTNDEIYNESNKVLSYRIYENMSGFLKKYTTSIGALKYLLENKSFKSNSISTAFFIDETKKSRDSIKFFVNESEMDSSKKMAESKFSNTIGIFRKAIDSLSINYNRLSENSEHVEENYLKDLKTAIYKLTECLNYLKRINLFINKENLSLEDRALMMSDILYSLKMEIIPNIEYCIKYLPALINSKDFVLELSKEVYETFIANNNLSESLNNNPEPFISLVSKLYEFDRTKTFSEYVNLISLLDEVFTTGSFKTTLSNINSFVKDYTEVTTDANGKEILIFNVESFLVKLESLKSDKINRFQFHFTVGMNTTSFINGGIDLGNGEKISNFSHFSEKIGLKIKLINRGDWMSKDPGETYGSFGYKYIKITPPKEPVISNWHILIYGSGLLYTVINSSTNSNFDYPMVGIGTGVTFFNDLDFNVSVGIPLLENGGFGAMTDNAFVSFGFDIQIAEYLKGVAKKRRERKRAEQIISNN